MPDFSLKLMSINYYFHLVKVGYIINFTKNKPTFSIRSSLLRSWATGLLGYRFYFTEANSCSGNFSCDTGKKYENG